MPLDRRQFLAETGRLAAGSALGLTALADESAGAAPSPGAAGRKTAANDKIACAMIGVGGRGRFLLTRRSRVNRCGSGRRREWRGPRTGRPRSSAVRMFTPRARCTGS